MWYVVGYAVSLGVGDLATDRVARWMRRRRNNRLGDQSDTGGFMSRLVGITERILYTTALLAGKSGFIAVWLTLKFADRWQEWRRLDRQDGAISVQPNEAAGRFPPGWGRANIFFVGNALSLIFAFVGAVIIKRGWPQ